MESTEDDAGTATNASRPETARESNIGVLESVNATSSFQEETIQSRTIACHTPVMSEDNFDGDSVPSPSTQDVNTSTEAILDMIDEIVDGPGAPKRLPLLMDTESIKETHNFETLDVNCSSQSMSLKLFNDSAPESDSTENKECFTEPVSQLETEDCSKSVLLPLSSTSNDAADKQTSCCTSVSNDGSQNNLNLDQLHLPQSNNEISHKVDETVTQDVNLVARSIENLSSISLPSIPSISVIETEASVSDVKSALSEQIVKCVTSSDSKDHVVVESAESTSSDNNCVSDVKPPVETSTHAPLRRRLVRPVFNRPDSTVSSTVDSNISNTPEQSSECIAKDVSSSSDAVSTVNDSVKLEEVRSVSEISICKAETSSPPKKIRLNRQRSTLQPNHAENIVDNLALLHTNEQCQSTSSDIPPINKSLNEEIPTETFSNIIPQISQDVQSSLEKNENECSTSEQLKICSLISIPNQEAVVKDCSESSSLHPPVPIFNSVDSSLKSTIKDIPSNSNDTLKLSVCGESNKIDEAVIIDSHNLNKNDTIDAAVCLSKSEHTTGDSIVSCPSNSNILLPMPIDSSICQTTNELSVSCSSIPSEDVSSLPISSSSSIETLKETSSITPTNSNDTVNEPLVNSPIISREEKERELTVPEGTSISLQDEELNKKGSEKTVPKLTIKVGNKQSEEPKGLIPKLTIKPLKPPQAKDCKNSLEMDSSSPCVTKISIKPIQRPAEKINELHRKSSSSEISESEYSENDESTSDQTSMSDQGPPDIVPKVTIKLGKPGTDTEGKFYTEPNIPKLTIKGLQNSIEEGRESPSKLKVIICQSEENEIEKVPKLTIKTFSLTDNQPQSPKLTIKPLKPPDPVYKDCVSENVDTIPKLKIQTDSSSCEHKDVTHVPKITIKPITKPECESSHRSPKKSSSFSDNLENIPIVTKLNIKPIIKPAGIAEEGCIDLVEEKVPVVPKINIKPIVKPNESDFDKEDIPKVTKINIKPIKSPESDTSDDTKDGEDLKTNENSVPVITKLNIKPVIKPSDDEETSKESENHSSETGNSSDENNDHIPVVTKINIKPICKPPDTVTAGPGLICKEGNIPFITKLNIKPLVKPDSSAPLSPKRDRTSSPDTRNQNIPVVTKLNIKPVLKPEEEVLKSEEPEDVLSVKNPPLLMKINRKTVTDSGNSDTQYHIHNSDTEPINSICDKISSESQLNIEPSTTSKTDIDSTLKSDTITNCIQQPEQKIFQPNFHEDSQRHSPVSEQVQSNCTLNVDKKPLGEKFTNTLSSNLSKDTIVKEDTKVDEIKPKENCTDIHSETDTHNKYLFSQDICTNEVQSTHSQHAEVIKQSVKEISKKIPVKSNCILLKKLLESRDRDECIEDDDNKLIMRNCIETNTNERNSAEEADSIVKQLNKKLEVKNDSIQDTQTTDSSTPVLIKVRSMQDLCNEVGENVTKPLEIKISERNNQSSDQDSPRIILKINKTDHGASAKIITEEMSKLEQKNMTPVENRRKQTFNSKKKQPVSPEIVVGKRLRSSRIVQSPDKTPLSKRNIGRRSPSPDASKSPQPPSESEFSMLHVKRLKLGQLLSQKSLTITPVVKATSQNSPPSNSLDNKQSAKIIHQTHSLLNNENCSKNGSSKLHNILSNLQGKQIKVVPLNDLHHSEKKIRLSPEIKSDTSMDEPTVEISSLDHSCSNISETIYQENSGSQDKILATNTITQDPLEVENQTVATENIVAEIEKVPSIVQMTPQPKKRGRPRKLPVSEGAKPIILPTPALEERPQRSLRLSRERPVILVKPRGRGRGRGRRIDSVPNPQPESDSVVDTANNFFLSEQKSDEIDPTSSRIKLPRLTEALDKMPSTCVTPLTSRRRHSSSSDINYYESDPSELKAVMETGLPRMENPFAKSTEVLSEIRGRGRGGRGFRGRGRASPRTPRGRGRGRGGGRGAKYMKETLGIYGRVCGPATTTVQLFEEETCMMDDNATPSKPSHLLDEDSQSSVKSSTNESSKLKKSKFADLFDSNKVWTAADVKEYTWPTLDRINTERQVMMIQEQVAMFLNVKSFKRRYPELKRRAIIGEEKDFVLSKGLVTEALCDLGITAVDASEVLDIMLSDYPHKYEEYRTYQRERQLTEPTPEPEEVKHEKLDKIDMKSDSRQGDSKPDQPKVDPEKLRQEMAAAAIASASEWNARLNASRRPACVDLQSLTIQRRRAAFPAPAVRVRPPHGFYPLALLPGQYQHTYRVYSPEELRYFPLNTAVCAPPAAPPPSSLAGRASPAPDSDTECGSRASRASTDTDDTHRHRKRKKLTKVKRSSGSEGASGAGAAAIGGDEEEKVDTCRLCKLRLEANRKVTHERFLVCSNCNAKYHPSCVDLNADTVRKCRDYPWQCAYCKTCGTCARPVDDDKMLFCDLCDRGFHIYCVGLATVPEGRWHCVECAICKSCGARSPSGAGEGAGAAGGGPRALGSVTAPESDAHWHHHTKRGPSGHKVYSHSLCTPCARAYRIGRYCPLCDRSFIGPKGTMQLVICKLCDRQLHQDCVKQTVSKLNVLDYTCGECRRGGITSRAAAVRLAPRTIATLFMAKRRFNKYAHRQYMQKCLQAKEADDNEASDAEEVSDPLEGIGDPDSLL